MRYQKNEEIIINSTLSSIIIMYNIKSRQAEEFINHQEILDTLEYAQANRNNRPLIESLIDKAALCQGLSHREAALLLECDEPELVERISIWHAKSNRNSMATAS